MTNKNQNKVVVFPSEVVQKKKLGYTSEKGSSHINLSDYEDMIPRKLEGAKFIGYAWIDLNEINENDEGFINLGVRGDGTTDERIDELSNEFSLNGWRTTHHPPAFTDKGVPIDGRGRTLASKKNNQAYMPAAIYEVMSSESPVSSAVSRAIKLNATHAPAHLSEPKDYEAAIKQVVESGEVEATEEAIDNFLINVCDINSRWKSSTGMKTKIRNKAMADIAIGSGAMKKRTREQWIGHLTEELSDTFDWDSVLKETGIEDIESLFKRLVFLKANNNNLPQRAWCEYVLPRYGRGEASPLFVLFSDDSNPTKVKKEFKKFEKKLKGFYKKSLKMSLEEIYTDNMMKNINLDKMVLDGNRYKVLGAVPQFSFQDSLSLVEIDKYDEKEETKD